MTTSRFHLRVATADDAAVLSAIASRTFVDTFGHLYTPQDLANYLAEAYEIETIRSEIQDPMKYTVLLFPEEEHTTPCGYAMLHDGSIRTGDNGPAEDYFEIKRFYIDKPFHGQGAARIMMDHVMEIVWQKNRKITWLGVWENNLRAQKFYQKYGFVETGEHVFMVGTAADRDLLYTLQKPDKTN